MDLNGDSEDEYEEYDGFCFMEDIKPIISIHKPVTDEGLKLFDVLPQHCVTCALIWKLIC